MPPPMGSVAANGGDWRAMCGGAIAYHVPFGGEIEQELNWAWMYGELPAGKYKLVKGFMDFRGAGDFDEAGFEVEFVIE